MKKGDVIRFFKEAGRHISVPVAIYLTGGVASWYMGGDRPTDDIDFGLKTAAKEWEKVSRIFQETSLLLGIPIQFSQNISRWSMIEIPEFTKGAKPVFRDGKMAVYRLDPYRWSVGKIARHYQSDIDDVVKVFKNQKVDPKKAVSLWSKALKESPASSDQFLFTKQVENFLTEYGPQIWGKGFDAAPLIGLFHKKSRAKIPPH